MSTGLPILCLFLIHVVGLSGGNIQVNTVSDNSVHGNSDKRQAAAVACSILPKISIVSYFRDGFTPNASSQQTELIRVPNSSKDGSGTVLLSPFEAKIGIECEASVPIEWTFDDPNGPELESIVISREDDEPLKPAPCFRISIRLITTNEATGKYWCRTIGSSKPSSWLYLYGNGNGPPFLLNNDKLISIIQNDTTTVVLPCRVINPTLTPRLFKGESTVVSIQNSLPYNPQIGFTLDLGSIPDPYDTYKCTQGDGSVTFKVKPMPEYRVTPSATSVTRVNSQHLNLTCEGKRQVGIQGFLFDSKATIRRDESGESEYEYSVTYDLEGTGDFTCIDLSTTKKFHEWKVTSISAETERKSGISYDGKTHEFNCYSKTKETPVIALVECSTPIECHLADKCFSWNAPYKIENGRPDCPFIISRGSVCRGSNNTEPTGCAYVLNTLSSGVVHCMLPNNAGHSRMYFFNGLLSGAKQVFSNWHEAPVAETANIQSLEPNRNRTFYTGQIVPFQCSAQKFLFANGIRFMFRMENGSYVQPETVENPEPEFPWIGKPERYSLIIATSRLLIMNTLIREVVCFVPFWNTTEWLNISMPITVLESTEPKILMPEQTSILPFAADSEQSLRCEAEGVPAPHVVWYRRGMKAEHQSESNSNNLVNRGRSIIYFGHVDQDDVGVYICNASNIHGSQTRNFTLTIAPGTRKTLNTAIVLGSLTFLVFVIIVTVLCTKLRKKEQIIAKLSEKEIREFREGDTLALRSAPDGYIRAQYLPYDKEYEILQENLNIEEEIILGKGEYGIVMKGTLRQNDCLKEVAVKTIRGTDVNHFKALLSELKILTYIGWHDNVINLLGAVTRNLRDRDVYVVVEYCRLGDLESFLRKNKNSYLNQIIGDKIDLNLTFNFNATQPYQTMQYTMSTTDLISWAYQIASGMEYLANKKVIHGDLAPRNILLTEDRTIKITDFGLSKHLYNDCSNYISHATMDLPWKLCAPEVLQYNSIFSTHSDEWAFGVTLWEMFSLGENPYQGVPFTWDFKTRLLQGYRLDKPVYSNQSIYNQILHCWKNVPAERISFMELRKYFHWLLHHWAEEPKPTSKSTNGESLNYLQIDHRPYTQMNIET